MRWWCFLLLAGCRADDWLEYSWDDRAIVCSRGLDDLWRSAPWTEIEQQLESAAAHDAVTFLHAHAPGRTVSHGAISRVLHAADAAKLSYVTFPMLQPGAPRAALALSFDDQAIEAWTEIRPLLSEHDAHVTFFVTRLHLWTPEQLEMLQVLRDDGHAIEAHSVAHLHAPAYVEAHGVNAYVADEVLPSIIGLDEIGEPVTAYAYPFGESVDEVDSALLEQVGRIRVGIGSCPY
ncbi:MAG TPA: polysaccharide deacetylase family protein [Kofleriaceae bacterium]|nr:polysaccharide deacetylase family protein [Kofleriaceae bacterium]